MSIAYSISQLICLEGIGVFASQDANEWSVNVGIEPAKPNRTITIYDTGGDGPDTDEMDINRKTVQIRVRSHNRSEASAKINEIRSFLLTKASKTIGTTRLFGAFVTTDVAEIGRDDNGRALFTINFRTLSNEV